MDLSKAFDCIPYDLLISKHCAYGLNGNALKYIYTYSKKPHTTCSCPQSL